MISGSSFWQRHFLRFALLGSVGLFSGAALADDETRFGTSLGEESCSSDGQCVIFQVAIRLNSQSSAPIVHSTSGQIVVNNTSNPYGAKVTREQDTCTKEVRVPRDVYRAIVSIMASLDGDGTDQPPALTPAQQTILLFYTTLMQQTLQFECNAADLGGGQDG